MRAALYSDTGAARDVLSVAEVPTPSPGPGDVRVQVAWSGVNPSDVKTRAGLRPRTFPQVIPHSDGAGWIDAVGHGVPASRVGERVWIWNGQWGRPDGTAAEYIVLPPTQAVRLPDHVSLDAGACLGIPALTAYHAVTMNGGVTGKSVLIAGGAGAVGHYALQFARLFGARQIITTVSSDAKARLANDAGAEHVINYRTEDTAARVLDITNGVGVERVVEVDLAANVGLDQAVTASNGDIVVYGSAQPQIQITFGPLLMKNLQLRFFIVYNLTSAQRSTAVAQLTSLLEANQLTHNIAARLPLSSIIEAHETVEQGRVAGNTIVDVTR